MQYFIPVDTAEGDIPHYINPDHIVSIRIVKGNHYAKMTNSTEFLISPKFIMTHNFKTGISVNPLADTV